MYIHVIENKMNELDHQDKSFLKSMWRKWVAERHVKYDTIYEKF